MAIQAKTVENSALVENLKIIKKREVSGDEVQKNVLNVAAYCRVSKKIELQKTSIETQMKTYSKIISEHPGWKLAGIYADKGISGTQKANRIEFNRLIEDCHAGKIDKILVKSVSRLARNTVDILDTVRELRDLGISILFEKEGLDTSALTSEMLLTLYSAFSQEESRSLSANMKAGIRNRYKMGKPKWTNVYGYKVVGRNEREVYEPEAKIVRQIYTSYYEGDSMWEIARALNEKKIPSPNESTWTANSIRQILQNEKYVGDFLMQKTYVVDHLQHKKKINKDATVEKYYKKDDHEAIVDRDVYDAVRRIAAMRDTKRGMLQYPYYGFLRCPYCGEPMVRYRTGRKRGLGWVCGGTGDAETQTERSHCKPFIVMDNYLNFPILDAIRQLDEESLPLEMQRDYRRIKKLMEKKDTVEYYYLNALVKKITFTDWDVMEITWKHGTTSSVRIQYDYASDAPDPHLTKIGNEYFVNGIHVAACAVNHVQESIERKERDLQRLLVLPQEPDCPVDIPIVEFRKDNKDENNKITG